MRGQQKFVSEGERLKKVNKNCRFHGTNFEAAGRRGSFQNSFSPTIAGGKPWFDFGRML